MKRNALESSVWEPPRPVPREAAWFLDIDGTLLELAAEPSGVKVGDRARSLLAGLHHASGGAVALISGRAIASADALFEPLRLPVAGQHGAERRDASGLASLHPPRPGALAVLRDALTRWAAPHPEVLIEDKGLSLAIHYRQAPALEMPLHELLTSLLGSASGDFSLQRGKMVFELRPAASNKGTAICEFLAEPPFRGRLPVFVGDDAGDEDGFRIVNDLGGVSIKVGAGSTAARWRLPSVAAVCDWLAAVAGTGT